LIVPADGMKISAKAVDKAAALLSNTFKYIIKFFVRGFMPGPRKLGIFWSENGFTLVETEGNLPLQAVLVSLGDAVKQPDSPFSSDLNEDLQTVAVLQKTLRDHKIDISRVYLSLPSKDVILRSFVVPAVKPEELGGLIEFEAKKYVPFDVKELAFVYHSTPLVENKIKKLRVIFCAARKDVLDRYERICEQANLVVAGAEPAVMGLAKVLVSRNHMRTDQRTCILHVDGRVGRMMFFDRGVIQFMREFPLFAPGGQGEPDAEAVKSRLLNEARNSMDYYDRRISNDKINEIIVLGPAQAGELARSVGNDLNIPVKHLLPSLNIAHFQACQVEGLYALGTCVSGVLPVMSVFNFIQKKGAASSKTAVFGLSLNTQELVPALQTAALCVAVLVAAFAAAQWKLKGLESKVTGLSLAQGGFSSVPVEDIKQKTADNRDKLKGYKKIRTKTDVAFLLAYMVQSLPEGVWLKDLNVRYGNDDKVTMDISGYVYAESLNKQLRLVNGLVEVLRSSKELSRYLSGVQLTSMQRQDINGVAVTYFLITCS